MKIITAVWKKMELQSKPYKEGDGQYQGMYQLIGVGDLQENLDEDLSKMNQILGNRYLNIQKRPA